MRRLCVRLSLLAALSLFFSGCAAMQTEYDEPSVSLTSFRFIPDDSIVPRFEIGLRIINPNRDPLKLAGMFYNVTIEDNKILSGVANDLPVVEGYGEEDILLEASVDMVGGAKLLQSLLQGPKESYRYGFNAKLDLGSLTPALRISEQGEFTPGGT